MKRPIYVPVSESTLSSISTLAIAPDTLPICEALGLFALQEIPLDSDNPGKNVEQVLARLFEDWSEHRLQSSEAAAVFESWLYTQLDTSKIIARIPKMDHWRICPVLPSAISSRQFLTPRGEWDSDFKYTYQPDLYPVNTVIGASRSNRTGSYTEGQLRVMDRIGANSDDHLAIHGHAGSGKTRVIVDCLDLFDNKKIVPSEVLVLVQTPLQVNSLKQRLPKTYHRQIITFAELSSRVLPESLRQYNTREAGSRHLDKVGLARRYGIQPQAGKSEYDIVDDVLFTVRNYCHGRNEMMDESHLPVPLQRRKAGGYEANKVLRALVLNAAQKLWHDLFSLRNEEPLPMPIYAYHKIKLAAVLKCPLPPRIQRIVVDESHDLTPAMSQILHSSPVAACYAFGDAFQNFTGIYRQQQYAYTTLDLGRSFRSGRAMQQIVRPTLAGHLYQAPDLYHGNGQIYTAIDYYTTPVIPEHPSGIFVADLWALWEWVQRIADFGAPFSLLSRSDSLIDFADAVEHLKYGRKIYHWALSGYTSWQQLAHDLYDSNQSFATISNRFDRGYGSIDLKRAIHDHHVIHYADEKPNCHVLGVARDLKNYEFDRIFLTPDIMSIVSDEKEVSDIKASIGRSILYVAMTRGRYAVTAPIQLREWIEEITGRSEVLASVVK